MTISQVFKKVADKRLAEHGFKRRRLDGVIWVYERVYDGMKQSLRFQNHGSLKHLIYNQPPCMDFNIGAHSDPNNDYGYGYPLTYLFPIDYIRAYSPNLVSRLMETDGYYCAYRSFEELEEVISEYVNFTLDKAMHIFSALIKPYFGQSEVLKSKRDELQQKLSDDLKLYADNFAKKYNQPYNADISFIKDRIKHIEGLLLENKDKNIDELDELFLTSAAYLGELVIKTHGGKWVWTYDEKSKKSYFLIMEIPNDDTCIKQRSSEKKMINPLIAVIEYWSKPEIYSNTILSRYKRLLQQLFIESYYDCSKHLSKLRAANC